MRQMMNRRWGLLGVLAAIALGVGVVGVAADDERGMALPIGSMPERGARGEDGKPGEKPDYPPFEEFMKEFKEVRPAGRTEEKPFLTLYYSEKDDRLLAVIPKAMEGVNFLQATSIAGGSRYTGM